MNLATMKGYVFVTEFMPHDFCIAMTATDLRALTPLLYQHVNPYGTFQLDLERRFPFTKASAA